MSLRWIVVIAVAAFVALGYVAWKRSTTPAQGEPPPVAGAPGSGAMLAPEPVDPEIAWRRPAAWSEKPASGMRIATYVVAGAGGAGEAECAVYHFGPGQGGGTDANIDRWIGEFTTTGAPERSTRKVHGLTVNRVRVKGAYASHAGAMGEGGGLVSDQELLGAIVEGLSGSVYFKLTGPAATVDAAVKDFDSLLGSVRPK